MDELARKGVTMPRITLHDKIQKLVVEKRQLSNSNNPEEPQHHIVPEELQLYTVWKVFSMSDEQMKYPGQTPQQIIENLIYYYTDPISETTKPDDVPIILDPMAGSGIVGEVCKKMFRRYVLIDLKPINPEIIHQGDFDDRNQDSIVEPRRIRSNFPKPSRINPRLPEQKTYRNMHVFNSEIVNIVSYSSI